MRFLITWILGLFQKPKEEIDPKETAWPFPAKVKKPTVKKATARKPAVKKTVAKKTTKVVKKAK